MSSLNCHLRFSIVVLETLKFEWQCSQYLELNPTCDHVRNKELLQASLNQNKDRPCALNQNMVNLNNGYSKKGLIQRISSLLH